MDDFFVSKSQVKTTLGKLYLKNNWKKLTCFELLKYSNDFKAFESCPVWISQRGLSGVKNVVMKTGRMAPTNAIQATIRQCKYKPVQYINNIPRKKSSTLINLKTIKIIKTF